MNRAGDSGRLRVFVDASCLKARQGGIRSYTLGLVRALAAQDRLSVAVATPFPEELSGDAVVTCPIQSDVGSPLRRAAWRETRLRALTREHAADVVIIPLHEHPLRPLKVPTIMVMHDLGPLVAPALYGRARWTRYLLTLPLAVRNASAIVSMSHATQADLYANFTPDLNRCHVIETGTQPLPSGSDGRSIDGEYVLYVGSLLRHKNVRTLIHAFAEPGPGIPDKLVLAGPHGREEQAEVERWSRETGVGNDRVIQLGYVSAEILSGLYRHARVCVLPSLHEGFGAPIIEAMRLGTPFVASDIPAHREVARDAACYVSEVLSPGAWRRAIASVSGDTALRARLQEEGHERAKFYTWDRVGEEWAGLVEHVVRGT